MSSSSFLAGVPVEVDPRLIERELAALWKPASEATDGDEAVVRVCVSNLVVFLDDPARLEEASRTLERLSRRRPNRTIILLVSDEGDEDDDDPGDGISSRL
ncbi:MAG TPA: hypothetical protein VK116_19010, partial [Planctomycetota bacterium]|nr:hypothetical protein [Planctomycetota bacterium]